MSNIFKRFACGYKQCIVQHYNELNFTDFALVVSGGIAGVTSLAYYDSNKYIPHYKTSIAIAGVGSGLFYIGLPFVIPVSLASLSHTIYKKYTRDDSEIKDIES